MPITEKQRIERGEYPSQHILDVASDRALCDALSLRPYQYHGLISPVTMPQSDGDSALEGDTGGKQESPPPVPPPVSRRDVWLAMIVGVCGFGILAVVAISAIVGG